MFGLTWRIYFNIMHIKPSFDFETRFLFHLKFQIQFDWIIFGDIWNVRRKQLSSSHTIAIAASYAKINEA